MGLGCVAVMASSQGKGLALARGLAVANEGHRLGALLVHELRERDAGEEALHGAVELLPQIVRHAALVLVAVLAPAALCRVERLLDGKDDVRDRNPVRVAREMIAAARTAHALDERAPAQLAEELLEIRERDLLAIA